MCIKKLPHVFILTSITIKRAEKKISVDHSTRENTPSNSRRSAKIKRSTVPSNAVQPIDKFT